MTAKSSDSRGRRSWVTQVFPEDVTAWGILGRLAYGLVLGIILPILFVVWAIHTEGIVRLPVPEAPVAGGALAAAGLALILGGAFALAVHGGDLPMNAFPPPRYVAGGVFRYIAHPLYVGFAILCVGLSIASGSRSGLWLITPAAMAVTTALVLGYEQHDLRRRFGDRVVKPAIALPPDDEDQPLLAARLSVYALVFLPWMLVQQALIAIAGTEPSAGMWWGRWLVVMGRWSVPIAALLAPLAASTNRDLRRFSISGILLTAASALTGIWGPREGGAIGHVFTPAYGVAWTFVVAGLFSRTWREREEIVLLWAVLAALEITGVLGAFLYIPVGVVLFLIVDRAAGIWRELVQLAERLANAPRRLEWGSARVPHGGLYVGASCIVGLGVAAALVPAGDRAGVAIAGVGCVVVAVLWEWITGSGITPLVALRHYGIAVGVGIGVGAVALAGGHAWVVLAAFAAAAPWSRAITRLSCLVEGCCHGRPADGAEVPSITYRRGNSHATRDASLAAVPLHPAPLYSMSWSLACGVLLARLWLTDVPRPFIAGAFLFLFGVGRFVEEAYRGEPETPRAAGLPLHQWIAIAAMVTGAVLTGICPELS